MDTAFFIAKRIVKKNNKTFSHFIIKLATFATIISVAVMIIALAVVQGFKDTIKDKTFVFWGHIQVAETNANSLRIVPKPLSFDSVLFQNIAQTEHVKSVSTYALSSGIISTKEVNEGLRLKGIDDSYKLAEQQGLSFTGKPLDYTVANYDPSIILSSTTLSRINKSIDDSILVYFIDQNQAAPRIRKLHIKGSYHTGVEEIDRTFGLIDIRLIRNIFKWEANDINGYQILLDDYQYAQATDEYIYDQYLNHPLTTIGIDAIYPEIFQWLELQDTNTQIIIAIMTIVAVINMITAILIFILERNNMIGILKTLGMTNYQIRKIFLYHISVIMLKGIIIGVVLGVALCLIQQYTHILTIDEASYYMKYVPIKILPIHIIGVILGTFIISVLILFIPTYLVKKMSIIKAIQFK